MIRRIRFGKPYDSHAVVEDLPLSGDPTPFAVERKGAGYCFTAHLNPDDRIYGLGEATGKLDRRGDYRVSFNSDNGRHEVDTKSLYGSHNFILIHGVKDIGCFFDCAGKVIFDLGKTEPDVLKVTSEGPLDLYLIEEQGPEEAVERFLKLIGPSYIPPLWGFGYGQSRFSYMNEKEVRKLVSRFNRHGLPLDWICLDIHYMDGFADFSFDHKRFPDPKKMIVDLKEEGIYVVPIVDAGIKVDPTSAAYATGLAESAFVLDEDGKPFGAYVWPGLTHFPDVMNEKGRKYWGSLYSYYVGLGIEGFWNDMNEPSIFKSEATSALPNEKAVKSGGNPDWEGNGYYEDYRNFYHALDDGQKVNHLEVHNLFGGFLTEACYEGVDSLLDHRFLVFSRASHIGSHRYGGIWTGDNQSRWDHLRLNLVHLLSLNMCGFLYSGADTGGFGKNCSRELLLRWMALSTWAPLYRNHSAIFTRRQEPYRYLGKKAFASILGARYRLIPYLYSEFVKCAISSKPFLSPLSFGYPEDGEAWEIDDEFLVGEGILAAPVLEKGSKGRKVYLPEKMTEVTLRGDAYACRPLEAGYHDIRVPLDTLVFFIRPGKSVPLAKKCLRTKDIDYSHLELLGDGDTYRLYRDDGFTKNVKEENITVIRK